MLSSKLQLSIVCLVLLSQSIWSAPPNSSQVGDSGQRENLHQNEETDEKLSNSEEMTLNSAGGSTDGNSGDNRKAHIAGEVVRQTGPGGLLLSVDSSSTSTPETTEPFSTSSRKSLSRTAPTGFKSHSQSNIKEDDDAEPTDSGDANTAIADNPNKSDTSNAKPQIKDKIAAGDVIGQSKEDSEQSSASSETAMKNKSSLAHLHRIPLNRSNLFPSQSLLPPPFLLPPTLFLPSKQSQDSGEQNQRFKPARDDDSKTSSSSSNESGESESNASNTDCTRFPSSTACLSNRSSSSSFSQDKQNKMEEVVDVVLIPGAPFRPPTILIIDTIITKPNTSSESASDEEIDSNNSEEDGSSPMPMDTTITTTMESPAGESLENVSQRVVEDLNSTPDDHNATIRHEARLKDTQGSQEKDEMSGLHLRPWFINHLKKSNVSSGSSSTISIDGNSTPTSFFSQENDREHEEYQSSTTTNSLENKVPPISAKSHPGDVSSLFPDENDEESTTSASTDNEKGRSNDKKPTLQTNTPIVSISPGSLNRRRRDTIFSHLPNNSSRSQSVTHSAENNITLSSSGESNNSGNSSDLTSIESDETDTDAQATTTGKDTVHIFLEILHLQPISSDDAGEKDHEATSSPKSPHRAQNSSSADNSASDGSPDSTSNQNSKGSTSHRVTRRETHSVAAPATSETAGKSNPSPAPASSSHSPSTTSTTTRTTTRKPTNTDSQAKQSLPPAGKPTSTAGNDKPITRNTANLDLPPLLNVHQPNVDKGFK